MESASAAAPGGLATIARRFRLTVTTPSEDGAPVRPASARRLRYGNWSWCSVRKSIRRPSLMAMILVSSVSQPAAVRPSNGLRKSCRTLSFSLFSSSWLPS